MFFFWQTLVLVLQLGDRTFNKPVKLKPKIIMVKLGYNRALSSTKNSN